MNPLKSAQSELESLLNQKAEIDRRIEAVTKSIRSLETMDDLENIGITEAVERALMMRPGQGLCPTQVRDLLAKKDYRVRGDDPIDIVQRVLKRLAGTGTAAPIVAEEDASGKTLYRCISVPTQPRMPRPVIRRPSHNRTNRPPGVKKRTTRSMG